MSQVRPIRLPEEDQRLLVSIKQIIAIIAATGTITTAFLSIRNQQTEILTAQHQIMTKLDAVVTKSEFNEWRSRFNDQLPNVKIPRMGGGSDDGGTINSLGRASRDQARLKDFAAEQQKWE